MNDGLDRELPRSKATFGDLAARLAADRPEGCERYAEGLSAIVAGEPDAEAERHLGTCARCRDLRDRLAEAWREFAARPRIESRATFAHLRGRLLRRPVARFVPMAAMLLLGLGIGWLTARPVPPDPSPLAKLLDAAGRPDAWLQTEARRTRIPVADIAAMLGVPERRAAAIRLLDAVGGPEAEAALSRELGRDPSTDAFVAAALASRGLEVERISELGRAGRRDVLKVLLVAAPDGCAEAALGALRDPELRTEARRALQLRTERELRQVLGLYAFGPTPGEAAALVGIAHPVVRDHAIEAAAISREHRKACVDAARREGDWDFLMAAAGDDALASEVLESPIDAAAAPAELRRGLKSPLLRLGAVRLAGRLKLADLAPVLLGITAASPPREERALIIFTDDPPAEGQPHPLHAAGLEALGRIAGRSFAGLREAQDWFSGR